MAGDSWVDSKLRPCEKIQHHITTISKEHLCTARGGDILSDENMETWSSTYAMQNCVRQN